MTCASESQPEEPGPGAPARRLAATLAVSLLTALAGCASLPPGTGYPRTASTAYDHPESTDLGRAFDAAAQRQNDKSGFRIISAGLQGFDLRVEMIDAAEQAVDVQYFIFRGVDDTGELIAAALLRAADRGVRIRMLLDDGETVSGDERLAALEAHPKIDVRIFNPFRYRGHVPLVRFGEFLSSGGRLDYRMHNKLFVVDNAAALVGGRNVGDEYFQVDPASQFGDDDVFSVGPIVRELSGTFDEYWNSALAIPAAALAPAAAAPATLARYREELADHRRAREAATTRLAQVTTTGDLLAQLESGAAPLVWAHAQVFCDSPDKARVENGEILGRLMNRSIADVVAHVQFELLMLSPYLIPGREGMDLVRELRSRGARVRILTNSLESATVLPAQTGYMRYRRPLLEAGVELYEVRARLGSPRGSGESKAMTRFGTYALHAKLFVFDRQRVYIGSMNFDQRSMHLNTEIGLLIDSPELAQQTAARIEAIAAPANSYHVALALGPNDHSPRLAWRTEENGRPVELTVEPARSPWQRFKASLLEKLPIDREL